MNYLQAKPGDPTTNTPPNLEWGEQMEQLATEVKRLQGREQELLEANNRDVELRRKHEQEANQAHCDGLLWRNEVIRLRNLLATLTGYVETLRGDAAEPPPPEILEAMEGWFPSEEELELPLFVQQVRSAISTAMFKFSRLVKKEHLSQFRSTATFTISDFEAYATAMEIGDDELARAIVQGKTIVDELKAKRAAAAAQKETPA